MHPVGDEPAIATEDAMDRTGDVRYPRALASNSSMSAPDIVAAVLDDTLTPDLTLFDLAVAPPALWEEQRARIGARLGHHR